MKVYIVMHKYYNELECGSVYVESDIDQVFDNEEAAQDYIYAATRGVDTEAIDSSPLHPKVTDDTYVVAFNVIRHEDFQYFEYYDIVEMSIR